MDYGQVAPGEVLNIDYTLPEDGQFTKRTLNVSRAENPKFYVGLSKWGEKEFNGVLYPEGTKEMNFLNEYVRHFNSIELNAVFYTIPPEDLILRWREKAEENSTSDFLFLPKMSRTITHLKRLVDAKKETSLYLDNIRNFGKYLGPVFIQIGDNMGPKQIEVIKKFLYELPTDFKYFLEIRQADWFENPGEIFQAMRSFNVGTVITDVAGRRDGVHMDLTTPEAFIRFVGIGPSFKEQDQKRIDEWVSRIEHWLEHGLEKVYFNIHTHGLVADRTGRVLYTLALYDYVTKQFNSRFVANIPELKFL